MKSPATRLDRQRPPRGAGWANAGFSNRLPTAAIPPGTSRVAVPRAANHAGAPRGHTARALPRVGQVPLGILQLLAVIDKMTHCLARRYPYIPGHGYSLQRYAVRTLHLE